MPSRQSNRVRVPDHADNTLFRADNAVALTTETRTEVLSLPRLTQPYSAGKLAGNEVLISVRVSACTGSALIEAQVGAADDGSDGETVARLTVTAPGDYVIPVDVGAVDLLLPTGPAYLSLNITPGTSIKLGADIHSVR